MKGNSTTQPDRLKKLGNYWQVRWNIVRNDRTDDDGNTYESWDYEYANCENPYRDGIIEGIIRSKYSASQVEAIMANYEQGYNIEDYIEFQTWRKIAKTVANDETYYELELYKQSTDEAVDNSAIKRLLQKVAEPILSDEANLTEKEIEDSKMLYKQFRVGVVYDKDSTNVDEKRFVYNGNLYKVIGAKHTSQADWTPETAVSLYVKITPPGVIAPYEQRSAENPYMKGNKVTFEGKAYESLIDNNTWSPSAYPAGWKEV